MVLSAYSTRATAPPPGGTTNFGNDVPDGTFTWDQLKDLSIRSFGFTLPSVTYNLIKNNTDAELLAKPQLRISEGKKAQLVIGDRVPIPTTTFNTGTTVGGNIVPVTSFQYQDVGIKIEVEPRVHHNKEVTLKLIIEVSQVTDRIEVGAGQPPQPVIGTRTISSEIRLKDGETNFLAGLFRTDKSSRTDTVPFLGDIPVIGRLFSKKFTDNRSTDLVLTLTPHIIRIPDITEADLEPVYVGTDSNISFQGSPRIESPGGTGPFDFQPRREPAVRPTPAPAPTPAPQILVPPGGMPSDPFRPPPTPLPRQSVPPQSDVRPPGALATEAGLEKDDRTPRFDFDPASLSFGAGQDRIVLVRATGDTLRAGALAIRFDPTVIDVIGVRPILADGGVAESRLEPGRVVLQWPAEASLGGTRAVAEIIVRGVGPGRSSLALEGEGLSLHPGGPGRALKTMSRHSRAGWLHHRRAGGRLHHGGHPGGDGRARRAVRDEAAERAGAAPPPAGDAGRHRQVQAVLRCGADPHAGGFGGLSAGPRDPGRRSQPRRADEQEAEVPAPGPGGPDDQEGGVGDAVLPGRAGLLRLRGPERLRRLLPLSRTRDRQDLLQGLVSS